MSVHILAGLEIGNTNPSPLDFCHTGYVMCIEYNCKSKVMDPCLEDMVDSIAL